MEKLVSTATIPSITFVHNNHLTLTSTTCSGRIVLRSKGWVNYLALLLEAPTVLPHLADALLLSHGVRCHLVTLSDLLHHDKVGTPLDVVIKGASIPHLLLADVAYQEQRVDTIVRGLHVLAGGGLSISSNCFLAGCSFLGLYFTLSSGLATVCERVTLQWIL